MLREVESKNKSVNAMTPTAQDLPYESYLVFFVSVLEYRYIHNIARGSFIPLTSKQIDGTGRKTSAGQKQAKNNFHKNLEIVIF